MVARIASHLEESFLCSLLVLMTLLVFTEVILRFGFNTGLHWAQEVTLHTSAWFVLFGASYGVKVGAHIGVDALIRQLPKKGKRATSYLAIGLCLLYCGLFLYGGYGYISEVWKRGTPMEDTRFGYSLSKWMVQNFGVDGMWNALRIDLADFNDEYVAIEVDIKDIKEQIATAASPEAAEEMRVKLAGFDEELATVESPGLPLWFAHGPVIVGFLLLVFRFLQVLYRLGTGKIDTMQMVDEAKDALEGAAKMDAEEGIDFTGGAGK
jgi:C4-dicarboxylate transporter DctQ subunit